MKRMKTIVAFGMLSMLLVACSSTDTTTTPPTTTTPSGGGMGSGGGFGGGSVDTSGITTKYLDLTYGDASATQTLDIYLPNEGEGPFPVIVAVHGGAFKVGSKTGSDVASMIEGVNRGYAVVSVNYRLSGEAVFPAAVNDVKAAIRYVRANASMYNLNPDAIAAWGDSAGGNLVAMLGTTGNVTTLDGDTTTNAGVSSAVQAVVDWFGPIDFLKMDEQFTALGITPKMGATSTDSSPESAYIGQNITTDPALTAQANPESYIDTLDPATAPSFFIQHGTIDSNVPITQSENFAAALSAKIGADKVSYNILEGAGHGTSEFDATTNLDLVYGWLDSVLK
ncbi:MAG: alpha/beta hydrolase fold domain-containing protein [Erysipelotrichaceae bacterium]